MADEEPEIEADEYTVGGRVFLVESTEGKPYRNRIVMDEEGEILGRLRFGEVPENLIRAVMKTDKVPEDEFGATPRAEPETPRPAPRAASPPPQRRSQRECLKSPARPVTSVKATKKPMREANPNRSGWRLPRKPYGHSKEVVELEDDLSAEEVRRMTSELPRRCLVEAVQDWAKDHDKIVLPSITRADKAEIVATIREHRIPVPRLQGEGFYGDGLDELLTGGQVYCEVCRGRGSAASVPAGRERESGEKRPRTPSPPDEDEDEEDEDEDDTEESDEDQFGRDIAFVCGLCGQDVLWGTPEYQGRQDEPGIGRICGDCAEEPDEEAEREDEASDADTDEEMDSRNPRFGVPDRGAGYSGGSVPVNKKLYEQAKAEVYPRYKKPSAYRSGALIKRYKELGGKFKEANGRPLARWFKEDWKDIGGKDYPVYRPTKRISKDTPLTASELDPENLKLQIAEKQKIKGRKNLKPFKGRGLVGGESGSESEAEPAEYEMDEQGNLIMTKVAVAKPRGTVTVLPKTKQKVLIKRRIIEEDEDEEPTSVIEEIRVQYIVNYEGNNYYIEVKPMDPRLGDGDRRFFDVEDPDDDGMLLKDSPDLFELVMSKIKKPKKTPIQKQRKVAASVASAAQKVLEGPVIDPESGRPYSESTQKLRKLEAERDLKAIAEADKRLESFQEREGEPAVLRQLRMTYGEDHPNYKAWALKYKKGEAQGSIGKKWEWKGSGREDDAQAFLKKAKAFAKKAGYKDWNDLKLATDGIHKLELNGVKFGRKGYGDFIEYGMEEGPASAQKHRKAYLARAKNIKGDWKDDKYSKNNLAIKVLWGGRQAPSPFHHLRGAGATPALPPNVDLVSKKESPVVEEIIEEPMDDSDIRAYYPNAKIMRYSDLKDYKTIQQLLPKDKSYVFLLYQHAPNNGHWVLVMRYGNTIEYFCSYGSKIDQPLTWTNPKARVMLGEATPYLTNLLNKAKGEFNVIYNPVAYQAKGNDKATCGAHDVMRLSQMLNHGQDLTDYYDYMTRIKKESGLSYDELVANFVSKR